MSNLIIGVALAAMVAGLGNSFCTETKEKIYNDLEKFTFLLLVTGGISACCFLGIYQPFMKLWVGETLMLDIPAVICFAEYFYIYIFCRLVNVYKDAAGLWHADRLRSIITAIVNLGLNLLMVKSWGVYGVLLSTLMSMIFVGIPWVLRNLFTLFFSRDKLKGYVMQLLSLSGATVLAGALVCLICSQIKLGEWGTLIVCTGLSVLVPCTLFHLLFRRHRLFLPSVEYVDRLTNYRLKLCQRFLKKLYKRTKCICA